MNKPEGLFLWEFLNNLVPDMPDIAKDLEIFDSRNLRSCDVLDSNDDDRSLFDESRRH